MTDITADAGGVEGVEGSAPLEPGGPLGPAGSTVAVAAPTTGVPQAVWRLLLRRPTFIVGAIIIVFWVICALFGHAIAPYNPLAQQLLFNNNPPSGAHWFGTDALGRDVLSRVIVGARDILIVTPLATLLGTALGTTIGLVQGYFRGAVDSFTGRLVEAVLAVPVVIVAFLFLVALGATAPT